VACQCKGLVQGFEVLCISAMVHCKGLGHGVAVSGLSARVRGVACQKTS
jgi:hypothetical protein